MTLARAVKGKRGKPKPKRRGPVWKGPEEDGITQSLLSRFLNCRERLRLLVVEGLKPAPTFNHRIEYGQMWHTCEEGLAEPNSDWIPYLEVYAHDLCRKYPLQQEQVQHWYNACKTQFPIYVDYWNKHKERGRREPLLREQVFDVPYELPSGRVVRLRGKLDGVDEVGPTKKPELELLENKTKGDINEQQLKTQLQFDLQTMFYLVALQIELAQEKSDGFPKGNLRGVRYNVVRRPLSGGRGSIRQHKPTKSNPVGETAEHFYNRLGGIIAEEPEYFFMRWTVGVTPQDIERFKQEFLNPILESLWDWWEWIETATSVFTDQSSLVGPPQSGPHWRHPYGVYNVLNEGGSSELDEYLATGSELGLERTDKLFGELE